jgi:hypothetical protein
LMGKRVRAKNAASAKPRSQRAIVFALKLSFII